MNSNYDVLVIGSGTAGIFFAKTMAERGFSVLVVDSLGESRLGERLDVFHSDKDYFAKYNVPEPKAGDPDYLGQFEYGITKSAFDKYPKRTDYAFDVMRLPPFLKRLRAWAEGFGVEFSYATSFKDFVRNAEGKINGAILDKDGELFEVGARLTADATGIPSVARRKLPAECKVENFEIGPRDMFYVIIRYVRIRKPEDAVKINTGWAYYKTWTAPALDPMQAIFGVGANLSFDYAEECYKKFTEIVKLPEHDVEQVQKGATPYRRPPHSFVTDGFVVLGDAACITKPFSGEGITAAWNHAKIMADVASNAMKDGAYPTEKALWGANKQYMSTQGADFAYLLATLVNAVDCSPEENDYEFKHDIVFNTEDLTRTNKTFSADLSGSASLKLGLKVVGGVFAGKIRLRTVKSLLNGVTLAGKLKKHYKKYPTDPKGYYVWANKANYLWEKAGNMADVVEKVAMKEAEKKKKA